MAVSKPDSSYALTPDGLSIAIAYCDYRAKREAIADASGGVKRQHLRSVPAAPAAAAKPTPASAKPDRRRKPVAR